jgi:hypothetical protein
MASAWGKSWGKAWGNAWGRLAPVEPPDVPSEGAGMVRPPIRFIPFLPVPARRKRKRREEDLLFIQHH